ncbi:GntR family transcriptional regulator [Muricoccus radiodurans]|uniref:GntR family transcriptional regulator n=1 Tax=Muricoccus radiodurans TaxID=2231721 RepID=UPI003CEA2743
MTAARPGQGATAEAVARIAAEIASGALAPGMRLPAQALADRLHVSRSPIGRALRLLAAQGVVLADPGRGFTVAPEGAAVAASLSSIGESDVYFRMAEDRVAGRLPDRVTETALRQRYGMTRAQLAQVLNRIAAEGWAERRPGYGWSFSPVLTTPDALQQTYRLRCALEPAALLEPTYRLLPADAARCRAAEEYLLSGGIDRVSVDTLYERGVRFHETIVGASGNPFFLESLQKLNRVRRLLVYRTFTDRRRFTRQILEHLQLLDLLEARRHAEASALLLRHLQGVSEGLEGLRGLMETR